MKYSNILASLILFISPALLAEDESVYYWEHLSQEERIAEDQAQRYQPPIPECRLYSRPHRVSVKHREGNGIGYPRGYSTLEGFISFSDQGAVHSFLDLRAHLTNDQKWAYNAGLGLRTVVPSRRALFGANLFYDYRDGRHRRFNQIGAGVELLGKKWDFHANGYVPILGSGKKYFDGFTKFKGHSALFAKRFEVAMYGFDIALGGYLYKHKSWGLHTKLGGYYFHGDFGKVFGGGLFELRTEFSRYVTIKGQASYDTHFKWIAQGEIALNFFLGPHLEIQNSKLSCLSLQKLENRVTESVDRFEMIVTLNHRKKSRAINPLTGNPLFFAFVDNTSSSAGTFESPFPTLSQAQTLSPDVIYIFPGDGTSNGMNTGITLISNQSLIGSAAPFTVTTRFGLRTIPAQTLNTPIIQPTPGSNVINLANNNTVSGLTIISNPTGNSVGIEGNVVQGAKITFNRLIQTGAENSLNFLGFTGNLEMNNNVFEGQGAALRLFTGQNASGTIDHNLFACASGVNNAGTTVLIEASSGTGGGTQIFSIDFNIFVPPAVSGVDFDPLDIGTNATSPTNYTFLITNNMMVNPNNNPKMGGITIDTADSGGVSNFTGQIKKNAINHVALHGIFIEADGATNIDLDINNNFIRNFNLVGSNGAGVFVNVGTGTQPITLRLAGNDSAASPTFGGFGYTLSPKSGIPFSVQSVNGQLSGVEILNIGSFNVTGTGQLTFIPFTDPLF